MTMIEKVARAMIVARVQCRIEAVGAAMPTNPEFWSDPQFDPDADDIADAKAALRALLEPDEGMKVAGTGAERSEVTKAATNTFDRLLGTISDIFTAMIQHALSEEDSGHIETFTKSA